MSGIKISRILAQKEVTTLLAQIEETNAASLWIEEEDTVIYGSRKEESKEKYPIKIGNEIIGWVRGNKEAVYVASILSILAKEELEKTNLSTEIVEKYKEINILYSLSEKMGSTIGTKAVAKIVIDEIMKHFACTSVCIMVFSEESKELTTLLEVYRRKEAEITLKYRKSMMKTEDKRIQSVFKSGLGKIFHEGEETSKEGEIRESIICVPLVLRNKNIGVIVIANEKEYRYRESDLKLCTAFAFQAAIGIEYARLYDILRETFFDTVETLAEIIEMRDAFIKGHTKTVINYSLNIAKIMGLPKSEQVKVKLTAMLHNIGTIGISDELLMKQELTPEEYEIVKRHPVSGSEALKHIDQLKEIVPAVRAHHERYDGTGYPDALKGEEIPIAARIVAVADAVDVMINNSEYRDALSMDEIIQELIKNRGTQFDPQVVDVMLEICKDKSIEEIKNYIYVEA